ncbi:MAG: 50S ribosomal protein L18 [Alphaproteobacteria bacterium]|nr:50S ribosomal protein L18 [Alphaproteobacteria bacterium]
MPTTRETFLKRQRRSRYALRQRIGSRPRLTVFRSNRNIYAQIIDDSARTTLVTASSLELKEKPTAKNTLTKEIAAEIGKRLGDRAKEKGIVDVAFDRGGYQFHGRVKALADAAREAGLNF